MKASELRIGNYVIVIKTSGTIEDFEAQIQCADITRIFDKCFNIWNYRPIPLTEEWLVKFGFDKCTNNIDTWFINSIFLPFKLTYTANKNKLIPDYMGTNLRYAKVNYVHQLQNLYFALTGEELQIKL